MKTCLFESLKINLLQSFKEKENSRTFTSYYPSGGLFVQNKLPSKYTNARKKSAKVSLLNLGERTVLDNTSAKTILGSGCWR